MRVKLKEICKTVLTAECEAERTYRLREEQEASRGGLAARGGPP